MRRGGNLFLNKKALSDIVSTLLILLLVFVAVAILWLVVRNVIQQGTEQVSLGKFTLDLKIERVTVQTNTLDVKVKRNVGAGEFSGLTFIVDDGENSETIEIKNVTMEEYAERTFSLTLPTINPQNVKTVEVAPIFILSSGKEVVGDVKDTYEVSSGSSSSCTSTCSSLGYTCGTQTICGVSTNCGTCSQAGYVCSGGSCVLASTCNDTCSSLGYTCGTQTVCGTSVGCGTCTTGQTCSAGHCVTSCTDTCSSLGYTCGTQTVCGASTNCGTCATGQTCTLGTCVNSSACGDGTVVSPEQCDGSNLNSATCASVMGTGYTGTLSCSASCTFVTTACVAPVGQCSNIIQNGDFSSGTTSWTSYTNGVATFSVNSNGGQTGTSAEYSITTPGTNVQLYQYGISLYPNTNYVLSFDAYSNTGMDMTVRFIQHIEPYTGYGLSEVVSLGTSSQHYSIPFTTSGFTGVVTNSRFMLWFSDYDVAGGVYYIDSIEVREVYGDGSCNGS